MYVFIGSGPSGHAAQENSPSGTPGATARASFAPRADHPGTKKQSVYFLIVAQSVALEEPSKVETKGLPLCW